MSPVPSDPVALLPHRPPFRFVDAVDRLEPGKGIQAHYRVTGEEPFLAGHFPGNPVFPGVLQLEALAQAGAIAVLSDERYAGKLPLFGGGDTVSRSWASNGAARLACSSPSAERLAQRWRRLSLSRRSLVVSASDSSSGSSPSRSAASVSGSRRRSARIRRD